MIEKFHFKVKKLNTRSLTIYWINTNCQWLLRVPKIQNSDIFDVQRYKPEHICSLDV